ncbi:MAG: TRAP transporter small permease subunit [Pseudomonadota bacterium]
MRAGDILLLIVIAASAVFVAYDASSGGAGERWARDALPGLGETLGQGLGWTGWVLSPLLLLPLLAALWASFASAPAGLIRLLKRAINAIDAVNTAIADAARWFALGLVLVTAIIVVQRYVFGLSFTPLQESVVYMHALLFLLSAAATLLAGGHVRVDIIYSKLPDSSKAWTDIAGTYLALLPMCWLILDTSRSYVGGAWRILERSRESDGLALVFLLKTAIPVFAVMMIAQGAAMAARAALTLANEDQPPRPRAVETEL